MKIRVFVNNKEINDPNNLRELSLGLNFDDDRNDLVNVSVNNWELGTGDQSKTNDGAQLAYQYFLDGVSGGVGVFEGLPFRVVVEYDGRSLNVFDGYLDLSQASIDCEKMTIPAVSLEGKDNIGSRADGFTFEYLYEELQFFSSDKFIPIPYVISTIPNYLETVIALFTAVSVGIQLQQQLKELSVDAPDIINPFTALSKIAGVAIRIVFIVILIATLIKLVIDVFNLIIQKVKYHLAMRAVDLCEIGASYMGYTFKSSILEKAPFKDLVILPEKFNQNIDSDNGVLGFTKADKTQQNGFYRGTFGQLLRDLKVLFNGKIIVEPNNVLRLERRDYTTSGQKYQIPNVEKPAFTLNSDEFNANTRLTFLTDLNDKNTIQQYEGTVIQVQSSQITTINPRNVLMQGFRDIQINYALGKVKTELTFPEKIFNVFFKTIGAVLNALIKVLNAIIQVANAIIKVLNGIIKALKIIGIKVKAELKPIPPLKATNFGNLIEDRIGMLIMENDFVAVPKLLLIEEKANDRENKPLGNNASVLNADYIYQTFYQIDSFVPTTGRPNANQYRIFDIEGVPFCFEDFEQLKVDNKIIDSDGKSTGEMINLEWNIFDQVASMQYKINKLYTSNLKSVKFLPNGR